MSTNETMASTICLQDKQPIACFLQVTCGQAGFLLDKSRCGATNHISSFESGGSERKCLIQENTKLVFVLFTEKNKRLVKG